MNANGKNFGIVAIGIVYALLVINQFRFDPPKIQKNFHLEAFLENAIFSNNNNNNNNRSTRSINIHSLLQNTSQQQSKNSNFNPISQSKKRFNTNYENQDDYRKCQLNEPWPRTESHGCVVSKLTKITYCQFDHFRIDVDKLKSVRGGENLTTVMGQAEEVEFPVYEKGAFQTKTPPKLPTKSFTKSDMYYIHDLLASMETHEPQQCQTTIPGTTMFLTRYEYCNLYHTMTDWWNTFFALPTLDSAKSTHFVFLDAHPQGSLDAVWGVMFANVTYVQHLPKGGVCFEKAVLVPPGYMAQLWPRHRQFGIGKRCPPMTDAFVQFMIASHNLEHVAMIPGLVVLIDRIPYIGHPRSNPAKAERIIQNMHEVRDMVAAQTNATEVRLVQFETMTFRQQLELIRSTHVLIGNHGAGIAHLIFLQDGAHVLEFEKPVSQMMTDISAWKPAITHTLLPSVDSRTVSADFVRNELVPAVKNALNKLITD